MNEEKNLSALHVAVMYVGAIMGAGFASGRETWQFFGVFGEKGRTGAVIFAALFMIIGLATSYIARKTQTNDMGSIIVPGKNKKAEAFVGYFMAVALASVMVVMTAAGGSLLNQQFGLHPAIGGALIAVLVIATVLGEFQRMSKVFRYVMPVLCIAMIITCITVIIKNPVAVEGGDEINPSPVAPNWLLACLLYTSYNVMAMIAIVGTSSIKTKDAKTAMAGTAAGGVFLGLLAMMILVTVQRDMPFSQAMDLPVLGYADRISKTLGLMYTIILFCAVYSAATSNFYGFTTKLKEGPSKKKIIIATGILAFALGLVGFKKIVEYLSPIMGYAGMAIIIMLLWNFVLVWKKEHKKNET